MSAWLDLLAIGGIFAGAYLVYRYVIQPMEWAWHEEFSEEDWDGKS